MNALFKLEDDAELLSYKRIMTQVESVIINAYVDGDDISAHTRRWIKMVKFILEEEKIEFVGVRRENKSKMIYPLKLFIVVFRKKKTTTVMS